MTTVSMESGESQGDPEARLADFSEEEERCVYRLGESYANCNEINAMVVPEQILTTNVGQKWK